MSEFTISVTGTPADVRAMLTKELTRTRSEDTDAVSVATAISDAIGRELAGSGVNDQMTVMASFSLSVTSHAIHDAQGMVQGAPVILPDVQRNTLPPRPAVASTAPGVVGVGQLNDPAATPIAAIGPVKAPRTSL